MSKNVIKCSKYNQLSLETNIFCTRIKNCDLAYFWDVVQDGKDDSDGKEVLLDGEVLERVDNGEVALQRHGHRHVD